MGVPMVFKWLLGVGSFFFIWLAYVAGYLQADVGKEVNEIIIVLPIYLLISFACYSLAVVGYRVATFNDCEEASKELREHIEEARRDLEKRGYKYASELK